MPRGVKFTNLDDIDRMPTEELIARIRAKIQTDDLPWLEEIKEKTVPEDKTDSLDQKIQRAYDRWSERPFYLRIPQAIVVAFSVLAFVIFMIIALFWLVFYLPVKLLGAGAFFVWLGIVVAGWAEIARRRALTVKAERAAYEKQHGRPRGY